MWVFLRSSSPIATTQSEHRPLRVPAALPCPMTLHLGEKSNVHLEKALFAFIVFKATPFQRLVLG